MKRASILLFSAAVALPSCFVYGPDLFDDDGSGGSGGQKPGGGGGTGPDGSGGDASGGDGGSSGGAPAGGGSGGGDPGSGGSSPSCEEGNTGAFTGVSSTQLLDSFDTDWPTLTNEITAWNGYWSSISDTGIGTSYTPRTASAVAWAAGGYEPHGCDANDLVLHISAEGSNAWGVGFNAQLTSEVKNQDLSEYDGVIFWARTENSSTIKITFTDEDTPNGGTEAAVPPLNAKWAQRKIPFPGSIDKKKIAIVKIVGFNIPVNEEKPIDFWIDDVSFYKN